jgi:subtilisin family serine protease
MVYITQLLLSYNGREALRIEKTFLCVLIVALSLSSLIVVLPGQVTEKSNPSNFTVPSDFNDTLELDGGTELRQFENCLTIYTSSGKAKNIPLSSSTICNSLSTEKGASIFINDLRGGDKVDKLLKNITMLVEEGYIQNDMVEVIILLGQEILTNAYRFNELNSSEQVFFENWIKQHSGRINSFYFDLPFIAVEIPYNYLFDMAQLENAGHIFLNRRFSTCLAESVPIIKPAEKWSLVEQHFGFSINGSNVRIAVLDTGIDKTHPDLAGKVVLEKCFTNEERTMDGNGHGTHCASIAAGTGIASNFTYVGVAPGALLQNGKVLTDDGYGYEDWILSGIEWAVENSADGINLSLGADENGDGTDPLSLAVDWASDQGVVCAVAAGNSGEYGMFSVGLPAVAKNAITVGATNKSDEVAFFSSQGLTADYRLKPDVCAPGFGIVAARANNTHMGSIVNEYYTKASGTSMATPHVAGAVALLLQAHPDWNPSMVKSALMGNAKILDSERLWEQGAGRIDVCNSVNTTLLITDPSVSFGNVLIDTVPNATFTIINTASFDVNVNVSSVLKCDGEIIDYVHLNVTALTIPACENRSILMTLGPIEGDAKLGWWEGWLNITGLHQIVKAPYFAGTYSLVEVSLYDTDRKTPVASNFVLSTYPERNFIECMNYDPIKKPRSIQFFTRPGNYSLVAAMSVVWRLIAEDTLATDCNRRFMIEELIEVPRLSHVKINISLADFETRTILAQDLKGNNLQVQYYQQAISGGPYQDEASNTTLMSWTLQGSLSTGGLMALDGEISLYTSEFSDPEKLSEAFGFFGSTNSILSEVYLLAWKYWNTSIPTIITQSFSDLAKYNVYYDMPEEYPLYIHTDCYLEFTLDYMSENQLPGWGFGTSYTSPLLAGVNATYYMTPEIASYWGRYYIVNAGYEFFRFAPEQRWFIHEGWPPIAPQKGETGYLHLGKFDFGPYSPGLTIQTMQAEDYCTISLTGDIWENLTWPHTLNNVLVITDEGSWFGPMSPYPQLLSEYTLFVDGVKVAKGELGRPGVSEYHGFFWDNLSLSWNVTGQKARLILRMPSMATISESSIYQIDFDLTKNFSISPFFGNLSMPLNYSAEETIKINPCFRSDITDITLTYSFDLGKTWMVAEVSPEGFEVPCQEKRQLAIRINASDTEGNRYFYSTSPAALCRDVKIDVIKVTNTNVLLKCTDVEGKALRNIALLSEVHGNFSYVSPDSYGQISISKPPATENITVTFPSVGLYQGETLILPFKPLAGDLNRDGIVNIYDMVLIATAYGSKPGNPNWNPICDIAPPWNRIDIYDAVQCVADYGKKW